MTKTTFYLSLYIIGIIIASAGIICLFSILYPIKYKETITEIANQYNIEPVMIASIINAESGFDTGAISNVGAVGLMQLMPATAEYIAQKNGLEYDSACLTEPEYNITLGTAYFSYLLEIFGDTDTAICAYNAGPNKVKEWLQNDEYSKNGVLLSTPYPATNYYLAKIRQNVQIYTKFF